MATSSTPIVGYQPGAGIPGPGDSTVTGTTLITGFTSLINGQSYVDVVFPVPQPSSKWTLIEDWVLNTIDPSPLNIWPGIVTSKTAAGFRIQLNGRPDSINYQLGWAIQGASTTPLPLATSYLLTGPLTGGISTPATFSVSLPSHTTVSLPVTITPSDGAGGGTFSPAAVVLSDSTPAAYFTYTPASYGAKTISVVNDGGLNNPFSLVFTCVSSTYLFTGPSGGAPSVASTPFTVQLPSGGAVIGTVTVTPSAGGGGGTFTPTTVALTTGAPSATFTYTPVSGGHKTISVTNNGGLTNPATIDYNVVAPLADGDPVATWKDSSINGNDATQAVVGKQPTFKTNILNSKPVVRFASASSKALDLTSAISSVSPWTILAVTKPTSTSTKVFSLCASAASTPLGPYVADDTFVYVADRTGYQQIFNAWTGAFNVLTGVSSGALSLYANGTVAAPNFFSLATSGNFDILGYRNGPTYADGDVAEIIIYNVALSSTDRANVEKYLGTKYGITVAGGTAVQPDTITGLKGWWKADSLG